MIFVAMLKGCCVSNMLRNNNESKQESIGNYLSNLLLMKLNRN